MGRDLLALGRRSRLSGFSSSLLLLLFLLITSGGALFVTFIVLSLGNFSRLGRGFGGRSMSLLGSSLSLLLGLERFVSMRWPSIEYSQLPSPSPFSASPSGPWKEFWVPRPLHPRPLVRAPPWQEQQRPLELFALLQPFPR